MIKKIILGISILFSTATFAQQGSASPYSFFGIGDVRFKGTVENRSMGGLGLVIDSTSVNLQNPASYSRLKFTSFTVGGTNNRTNFKTNDQEESAQRSTLDYIAVGLPMGKFGAAFGLMPYSSVGYKVNYFETENGIDMAKEFTGTGGVNRVFAGLAYNFTPDFSFGADFQYNFGSHETKAIVKPIDVVLASRTRNTSKHSGFSSNFGVFYKKKLAKGYTFQSSVVFSPESTIKSSNERDVATITLTSSGSEIINDHVNTIHEDTEFTLPSKLSFAAGYGNVKKWFAGAEIVFKGEGDFAKYNQNSFYSVEQKASKRFSLGGYYIPKYDSFSNYFDRITYRAGYKFEETGLVINNKSIVDHGVTVGLGLPVGNILSKINLGLEYGKRGTRSNGLIEENYFNVSVGLSFSDRWFIKTKYD
ncbi:hypothetical protein [Flavobacterium pedocola]